MFRSPLFAVMVACAGFTAFSSVRAVPMIDSSNSTQAVLSLGFPPDNIFYGINMDVSIPSSLRASDIDDDGLSEIDRRQLAAVLRGAAKLISKIVDIVKGKIEKDKLARSGFTQHVVDEGRKSKPEFNWIVCHTKHRTNWKGVKGKDWDHEHKEFDVKVGGTVGYEVYYAREGDFYLNGDGGYLNWAMSGFFKRTGKGGKHVVFTRPPGK